MLSVYAGIRASKSAHFHMARAAEQNEGSRMQLLLTLRKSMTASASHMSSLSMVLSYCSVHTKMSWALHPPINAMD